MHRTILHIDADAFFASVEQAFNPKLANRPVIVGGSEDQRGVVHTASYEARRLGVYTGMPLRQAKRLVPQAAFLKGNFEHYQAISKEFQQIYYQFTPAIEMTSLDDAYLDLTGTLRLHRQAPLDIARTIQQKIYQAVKVPVSCGVGSAKLIARIASGSNKPHGLTNVPIGNELDFLHPLPVEKLPGIGRVACQRLHRLEIYTIGQLAKLPKLLLIQEFGINGRKFWQLANGIDPREVKEKSIPRQISRETGFEEDTSDSDVVKQVARYLTERITKKLREDRLIAQTVGVKLDYTGPHGYRKSRGLAEKSSSTEMISDMVNTLLQEAPFRRLRIHRVGVTVTNIQSRDWQGELFNERAHRDDLEGAIDAIRQRFGFMSIMPASLINLQQKYRMEKSGFILHAPALTQ